MKKKIHLFFRKSIKNQHSSIKNWYYEVIRNLNNEYLGILKGYKFKYQNYVSLHNKQILKKYIESDVLIYASKYVGLECQYWKLKPWEEQSLLAI